MPEILYTPESLNPENIRDGDGLIILERLTKLLKEGKRAFIVLPVTASHGALETGFAPRRHTSWR